jgi:hypothetical protein
LELFNTSTPEKAFKTSVRPLGGLFILQGVFLLHTFLTWPVEQLSKAPIPFIPDPFKKYFLIATALLIFAIGIGLFFRSKSLWYVFIAYLVISPVWMILGLALDYFPVPGPKIIIVTAAIFFAAIISGGLYIVTKPAFIKNS